ncbi:ring-cleaving dioxygenase [Oceanobacillus salinisoli]|uniref:ring-cleaving dioxygenase n=1 Tax=Oceanobacillus salinisoli TaxID=2678611 RepID=UPI0012E248A3|nr:ring-cleaving dioxygenase [Oceanobacillus salinisoli]
MRVFLKIPAAGSTHRGTNAITQIGLLVPSYNSLLFWKNRLSQFNVKHGEITTYAGRDALHFEDPEGLRLILLNNNGRSIPDAWQAWTDSVVPEENRILGMGSIEITVNSLDSIANMLENIFNYKKVLRTENEAIYQAINGEIFGEIVIKQLGGPKERPGKGSIHHLAIRVEGTNLQKWDEKIKAAGYRTSGVVDRYYFNSIYFREANGVMFEVVSDGPGFTADSTVEELGTKLGLPPFLEERRGEIEANLVPIEDWKNNIDLKIICNVN